MNDLNLIKKKRILIVTILIGLLLTILIGFSAAYIAPIINGTETSSTLVFNSGSIDITYEMGSSQINAKDVLPGWTAIKEFSLIAKNNTSLDSVDAMSYELKLVVEKNTFSDGAITYSIEGETVDNNGTVAYVLPNTLKSGASKVSLGYGTFDTSGNIENGVVHNYTLTLAFPNKTYTNQNSDMGKQLSAYITIEKPGELANLTIIDGQHNINKTVKFEKNSTYELPNIASKTGAYFSGWNVESGNATINGNKITLNGNASIKANYSSTIKTEFAYTGSEQTFTAPVTGTYKLETWGAQGGNGYDSIGGYGGYSVGYVKLKANSKVSVVVGASDLKNCDNTAVGSCKGGYNGGGNSHYAANDLWGGGGGATHIATTNGLLSSLENTKNSILIVSGGGGGAYNIEGAHAGGFIGNNGYDRTNFETATGGSQTSGGSGAAIGSFGQGGNCTSGNCTGGGGGYYGGGGAWGINGAGGSGYIGNSLLTDKAMYCYNCTTSNDINTKTISTTCREETPTENCAKKGNGYARITIQTVEEDAEYSTITVVNEEYQTVTTIETKKGNKINIPVESNPVYEFDKYEIEKGTATIDGTNVTPTSDSLVIKVKYK